MVASKGLLVIQSIEGYLTLRFATREGPVLLDQFHVAGLTLYETRRRHSLLAVATHPFDVQTLPRKPDMQ